MQAILVMQKELLLLRSLLIKIRSWLIVLGEMERMSPIIKTHLARLLPGQKVNGEDKDRVHKATQSKMAILAKIAIPGVIGTTTALPRSMLTSMFTRMTRIQMKIREEIKAGEEVAGAMRVRIRRPRVPLARKIPDAWILVQVSSRLPRLRALVSLVP